MWSCTARNGGKALVIRQGIRRSAARIAESLLRNSSSSPARPAVLDISDTIPYYFHMEPLSDTPAITALRLFQASARLEEKFAAVLGSVHGLSLKDALLLRHVADAE